MKKTLHLLIILLSFSSCMKNEIKDTEVKKLPKIEQTITENELGIVVIESDNLGLTSKKEDSNGLVDCSEWGMDISVKTSEGLDSYPIEKDKLCKKADILFDGSQDIYSRSADPFVDITFNDEHGVVSPSNNITKSTSLVTVLSDSENDYSINDDLATKQYEQMGKLKYDYTAPEIDSMELNQEEFAKELTLAVKQAKEEGKAYARDLARHKVNAKTTKLTAENRQLNYDKLQNKQHAINAMQKLTKKTQEVISLRSEVTSLKTNNEISENNYKEKIELLEKRVEDYAKLSLLLKRENQRLALTGEQSNEFIQKGLKEVEDESEDLRYKKMLKLAKNIETDETLAAALHDTQKRTLQRKAQRMQTQADALAYHARADKVFNKQQEKDYAELKAGKQPTFQGKIARIVGVSINEEPKLSHIQLLLNEKNRSLHEILNEVLLDVQPMLGTWKLDIKLATHNKVIINEPWNISAEISLMNFFEEIKRKTKEIHGVNLEMQIFPETRNIVITDNF